MNPLTWLNTPQRAFRLMTTVVVLMLAAELAHAKNDKPKPGNGNGHGYGHQPVEMPTAEVPEPGTFITGVLGLGVVIVARRFARKKV